MKIRQHEEIEIRNRRSSSDATVIISLLGLLLAFIDIVFSVPGIYRYFTSPPLPVYEFTPAKKIIRAGDKVVLAWNISNHPNSGLEVTLDDGARAEKVEESSGTRIRNPTEDTVYTLSIADVLGPYDNLIADVQIGQAVIKQLSVNRTRVCRGDSVEFRWRVTAPPEANTLVHLGGEAVPMSGSTTRTIQDSQVVDLTAENQYGEPQMSSLAIDAVGPAILGFEDATKRIASGQPVRIAWDVIGASEVHVDGRSVSHSGTFEVTPTRDESHN